ncbi:ATP-dependent DNA helicase RecG [Acetobacter sp. TBRC 12305]|uniref:ATP-dependent DNA helicase RecG n=1 Tax=Acetobacter garciniae TaxID=2817435 RepID=A0A939HM47_9PROT|nr:ATP-dependent DNA helicase RecG [Acetobacter garciniae]MBX0343782.1 ATP-dependent DNA helicase RecG [Acetobacter garciniae]
MSSPLSFTSSFVPAQEGICDVPSVLAPVLAPLTSLPGVSTARARLLGRIAQGNRVADLLFCLPESVTDRRARPTIAQIRPGMLATLTGTVLDIRPPAPRTRQPWRVSMTDQTGILEIAFFSPWQARQVVLGEAIAVSGKVEAFHDRPVMTTPDYLLPAHAMARIPLLDPIWPLTAGLFGGQVRQAMTAALDRLPPALPEWHDPTLIRHKDWPDFATALTWLHRPDQIPGSAQGEDWQTLRARAQARLACDELLADQLAIRIAQNASRARPGRSFLGDGHLQRQALATFGHALTPGQKHVLREIEADMAQPLRMSRLVQGDVGAGKTLVALLAMLRAVEAGAQAAIMAPTEILARQHAATFERLSPVPVAFLCSSVKGRARKQALAAMADGTAKLVVGTHALVQESVHFADLGLAVVDEQHRFGVDQRLALVEKGHEADMLVMTATPIPRTLLLTRFGDMQISRLEGKPAGRKPVRTSVHSLGAMDDILEGVGRALNNGAQIFWVCPLVSESESLDIAAAEARQAALAARFGAALAGSGTDGTSGAPAPAIGLAHGRQDTNVREQALQDFATGKTRILVATTVIEVGVDVPSATVMVIEHAERFGLAQLHQLRGRVGRGRDASYCLLLHDEELGHTARRRLSCLRETEDGFVIADEDFRLRGGGEATGRRQSGLPEYRMASDTLVDQLLDTAHNEATALLPDTTNPTDGAPTVLPAPVSAVLSLFGKADAARIFNSG